MVYAIFQELHDVGGDEHQDVMSRIGIEDAAGLITSAVGHEDGTVRIVQVWQSKTHYADFLRYRAAPQRREAGYTMPRRTKVEFEVEHLAIGKSPS